MNIFVLDENPEAAAEYQCDSHVVKMIVESAQILSTAHRVLDGTETRWQNPYGRTIKRWILADQIVNDILYKATHVSHPSCIWARETDSNYRWLYDHFLALCKEYTARYGRLHATEALLKDILKSPPAEYQDGPKNSISLSHEVST
jgi:hypothetical protein